MTASANSSSSTTTAVASPAQANAGTTTPSAGSKRGHDGAAKGGEAVPQETPSGPPTTTVGETQTQTQPQPQARGEVAPPTPTPSGLGSAVSAIPAFPSPVSSSPRLRRSSSSSVSWSALLTQELLPPRRGRSPRAAQGSAAENRVPGAEDTARAKAVAVDAEDVSGGGPEASSDNGGGSGGGGGQHGGMKTRERAGGLTVVIPPVGSGAVVGHLRSPSEIMLDDIAESLADTSRKPSFARMQSVQVTFRLVAICVLACSSTCLIRSAG